MIWLNHLNVFFLLSSLFIASHTSYHRITLLVFALQGNWVAFQVPWSSKTFRHKVEVLFKKWQKKISIDHQS